MEVINDLFKSIFANREKFTFDKCNVDVTIKKKIHFTFFLG